jgi:hypothetical protein
LGKHCLQALDLGDQLALATVPGLRSSEPFGLTMGTSCKSGSLRRTDVSEK